MEIHNLKLKIKNLKLQKQGFSLVELMLAMVLLSIVIFGVVKLQTSNLTVSNTNKNELQANFYANQGIEIVKGLGYADFCSSGNICYKKIDLDSTPYVLADASDESDTASIPTTPFSIIFKCDKTGLTSAYKVTSIIEWADSTGSHNLADGGAVTVSQIIY